MALEQKKEAIRLILKDGGELEIAPESFKRLEIDLSNGQTLWVEGPTGPMWFLNNEPTVSILVMGGPGAIPHFHHYAGNALRVVALKEQRGEMEK